LGTDLDPVRQHKFDRSSFILKKKKEDAMAVFSIRRKHLQWLASWVSVCCAAGLVYCTPGVCAPETSQAAGELSASEKEKWVQQAVALYEQGEKDNAKEHLEQALTVFPENYAVPYYLGLIYLEQEDQQGAIAQWQQYLRMAPHGKNAPNIRKNVTLLLRQEARIFARQAVSRETRLTDGQIDDDTIAVTSFNNLGSENLGPLGKGMAAMLIADLSHIPDLQVVDRIKLHALLAEMELGTSGLVDIKTAPKVGKLLKAKHVTSGTLTDLEQENLIIASAVVDAGEHASISSQEARGVLKQFYDMEKQIACQIVEDLGKDCTAAPPGFNKIHTRSLPALALYSRGLDHFDEENYDEAREMFEKAIEEDPQFELAQAALLATPTSAMASMATKQMISSSASAGPSSTVAGTAVAGTSGSGSAIAATSTAGGVGFPPLTAIAAGAAAVGGGMALAGGSGEGDNGSPPPPTVHLTGDWRGTWKDMLGAGGDVTFSLTHNNDNVSGTVSISGNPCLTTGDISGRVSGTSANLIIQSAGETISLDAEADTTSKTLTGSWNFTASGVGCAGDRGTFSTSLTTGQADIRW
jgi:tetratricopeptide (TPR) repeat protein